MGESKEEKRIAIGICKTTKIPEYGKSSPLKDRETSNEGENFKR